MLRADASQSRRLGGPCERFSFEHRRRPRGDLVNDESVPKIKICGLTRVEDAVGCVDRGVHALGLNFWSGTPRHVGVAQARRIAAAVRGRCLLVGVFVDAGLEEIRRVALEVGLDEIQLHGSESPQLVEALLPNAYKAIGVREAERADEVLERARRYPGTKILLDTRVPGAMPGGTGRRFDGQLAVAVARERELVLAGGLNPENVAEAVAQVKPAWVDTASGVEHAAGEKDLAAVDAFVKNARGSAST
jgi:phosphoribosylanthranilate isomerase